MTPARLMLLSAAAVTTAMAMAGALELGRSNSLVAGATSHPLLPTTPSPDRQGSWAPGTGPP